MAATALNSSSGKWIMASVILASAMAFIDSTALNVVLPSLQQSLGATAADLFWVLNAYLLMLASLILPGGSLGDKFGRRKIFMLGIFIFIVSSVVCGMAPNVYFLIASRALQGVGGALMIPGSLAIISSSFIEAERGKAIGTWSAITTLVTVGGPIIGGALGDAGLWRCIFFINAPIGIVSLLILRFRVKDIAEDEQDHTLDYPGAATTVIGLALLTFGFLRIPVAGFQNWQVYATLGVGLLVLIAFVFIQRRSKHPMMPLKLFANKTFSGANLLTFFLYAGLSGSMLFLSLNMVQIQGYSQLQAGLTLLPFTILMILFARFAGKLADKHGPGLLLFFGPATAGVGLLWLSLVTDANGPAHYWTGFFPGILLLGVGMSFTVAPLTTAVMGSVEDRFSGTASGINNALTRIAGVFANAIFGALAIVLFSASLNNQVNSLKLNTPLKQSVLAQAVNLGNAKAPDKLDEKNKVMVEKAYTKSFIVAYSHVMTICAVLAFLAAAMSLLFIKRAALISPEKITKNYNYHS